MARGFGESRPVAPNTTPDGADDPAARARNRRVEIVIREQALNGPGVERPPFSCTTTRTRAGTATPSRRAGS